MAKNQIKELTLKVEQCKGPFIYYVQLNKNETNPYFLQNFQSVTTVCLIIHVFCKAYEPEIVFVLICRTGRTISGSQLLQNTEIIKQTVVLLWKF